jgi:ferredoxin-nitrate reductase
MRSSRNSIKDVWGKRTPYRGEWQPRVDQRIAEEPERWVRSCCVLCSNGCALDVGVKDGKIVGVRGVETDRVNLGRLGPKGLHGWEANNSPDRLTRPLLRDGDQLRDASWKEAMDRVVRRAKEVRENYTSGAIGIYCTGQIFLEEYYTLAVIATAGLGANHRDGNTRLCTATAAAALVETFGADGQPGSYADLDVTDCVLHVGHNVAETQTVLWSRLLDRRRGPRPPKLVVIDPRKTPTAAEADVHLAPRVGTNLAVLNGLLNLVIEAGHVDRDFIDRHTVGFERLAEVVRRYPPERVREISGVPQRSLLAAARVLGKAPTLVSTVLQGVYQSHQATASACQVNNLNVIRGLIGRPGCGVLQMNGQPTSENTRETGCTAALAGFRNYQNPAHVADLAARWNVDPDALPHWTKPSHAMEIFRHAEDGTIRFLWIIATNPAVSLPDLSRVRNILSKEGLFVVVQDAFRTETTELADVVLPAALWGEKTGTFTNADRTVHVSFQAVPPPGEAKSDLDIFLEFARRMDFRDRDGRPLVKWKDAEGAFEHWKECSRGRPCDYSGLTYEKLAAGTGVQWPCNAEHPDGTSRLYSDHVFPTAADVCEEFGHDLETGAAVTPEEYRANDPAGRAVLKAADYQPPLEEPDEEYPFRLTTGRVVHHWHTRTRTGRCKELRKAAPEVFVQVAAADAKRLRVAEGDWIEVTSRRGTVRAPVRVGGIERGHVFLPFHYGYWDEEDGTGRAANELTLTQWDPVSKQPYFKYAAVRLGKPPDKPLATKVTEVAMQVMGQAKELAGKVLALADEERRHVADYLGLVGEGNDEFVRACADVAARHAEEPEVVAGLGTLRRLSDEAGRVLAPLQGRHGDRDTAEPSRLRSALAPARSGAFGLLRDLQALLLMALEGDVSLTALTQAAQELRDARLRDACARLSEINARQRAWLLTQFKHRAGHTLIVPSP